MAYDKETAADRLEAFCKEWERTNTDKIRRGQYHMWGLNDQELDWRDLMILVAVARGEQSRYLELASRAMEGWRNANIRQIDTIGRLTQKLHDIRLILKKRQDDRNINQARVTKSQIMEVVDR